MNSKALKTNLLLIFFAYCSTWALPYAMESGDSALRFSNHILSLVCLIAISFFFIKTWPKLNKRILTVSLIFGAVFACMLIFGSQLALNDSIKWTSPLTWLSITAFAPFMAALLANILIYYDKFLLFLQKADTRITRIFKTEKQLFLCLWGIFFFVWFIGLLAAFPGIYAYDSIFQVNYVQTSQMSAHHPVLHTYWLYGCIHLGQTVFKSAETGLLIYSLTQMILLSGILAYILKKLWNRLPKIVILFFACCFAFLPYNILFSFSATKDVIFSGIFALLILKTYERIKSPEIYFKSFRKQADYVFWLFLLCAFRNTGIYAICFMVPFLLFFFRRYWKQIVFSIFALFLLWGLYTGPVYSALHIEKGSSAEMLSVPMQQMARSLMTVPERFTQEEREQIAEYIPDYEKYSSKISDYIKDTFNAEKFNEDKAAFIKLWIVCGLKAPDVYLDAWCSNSSGNWYPCEDYPLPDAWHPYIMYDNYTPDDGYGADYLWIERSSYIPALSYLLRGFALSGAHQYFPAVSMLFSPGIGFWVLLVGVAICIDKKNYRAFVPFSLMFGLWVTMMLGPIALLRYTYPLMLSVPVVMAICWKYSVVIKSKVHSNM